MSEPSEQDVQRFDTASDDQLNDPQGAASSPIAQAASQDSFSDSRDRQLGSAVRQGVSDHDFAAQKRRQEIDRAQAHIDVAKAEVSRLTQDNRLRLIFAAWIALMVTAVTEGGLVVIGAYLVLQRDDLDSAVLIAWFTAQVINTIGLAFVVARYLFPQPDKKKPEGEVEE